MGLKRGGVSTINHYWRIQFIALVLLFVSFAIAIVTGAVSVSLIDWYRGWRDPAVSTQAELIVQSIRLPRVLLAATVGAILASSGAVMQGLFRNPLADPSLIGVTAGASAGGSVMIVITASFAGTFSTLWLISLGAFAGGIVAVSLVYQLATRNGVTSVATMLLAGIAITALVSSLTGTLEFFSGNDVLRRISVWKMGGLDGANYSRLVVIVIIGISFFVVMPRYSSALNALLLGESEARYLGFNVERTKRVLIVMVAAVVGVSVAMAGTIAFVGLVVPHIARLLIGPNHQRLIPLSAVIGAVLLLVADTLARTLVSPAELPVGLVTAVVGAPFFISLLNKRRDFGLA